MLIVLNSDGSLDLSQIERDILPLFNLWTQLPDKQVIPGPTSIRLQPMILSADAAFANSNDST